MIQHSSLWALKFLSRFIGSDCQSWQIQNLLSSWVQDVALAESFLWLVCYQCYWYIFVKLTKNIPKSDNPQKYTKKWQISPPKKRHNMLLCAAHGEIILIWKHCNYFQRRNVFSMEPKVFSRRFFKEIHSKSLPISRIGPEVSL